MFKNTLNYYLSSITISTHGTYLNMIFVCFVHLFDRFINASENLVASILSVGEGWHNYHHVFPWDYKTAELGNYHFNYTTAFIHLFAKIGWAYDLKTTSTELVRKRASRTGLVDSGGDPVPLPWCWDDKDCPQSDRMEATIVNRKQGWSRYTIVLLYVCTIVDNMYETNSSKNILWDLKFKKNV